MEGHWTVTGGMTHGAGAPVAFAILNQEVRKKAIKDRSEFYKI